MHPLNYFAHCPVCGSDNFNVNDAKSKRCNDCGFVYYLNPSAATAAFILNENNELLVVVRKQEPARGTYDLPGGFCDMDETAEQGIAREVKEETNLDVTDVQYLFAGRTSIPIRVSTCTRSTCFSYAVLPTINKLKLATTLKIFVGYR